MLIGTLIEILAFRLNIPQSVVLTVIKMGLAGMDFTQLIQKVAEIEKACNVERGYVTNGLVVYATDRGPYYSDELSFDSWDGYEMLGAEGMYGEFDYEYDVIESIRDPFIEYFLSIIEELKQE